MRDKVGAERGRESQPEVARRAEQRRSAEIGRIRRPGGHAFLARMQAAAGNRIVTQLLKAEPQEAPRPPGGQADERTDEPVMQRSEQNPGAIRSAITTVHSTWNTFSKNTEKIEGILYDDYIPMLASHSKAAGRSKKTTLPMAPDEPQPSPMDLDDPPEPKPPRMLPEELTAPRGNRPPALYDPLKRYAIAAATGLIEWTREASDAARRKYSEMEMAVAAYGARSLEWRFGVDTKLEPDVMGVVPGGLVAAESKRPSSADPDRIFENIRAARFQVVKRREATFFVRPPDGAPTGKPIPQPGAIPVAVAQRSIYIAIANKENPWPFTENPRAVPFKSASEIEQRVKQLPGGRVARALSPKKGTEEMAAPPGEVHEVTVEWTWLEDEGLPSRKITFFIAAEEPCSLTSSQRDEAEATRKRIEDEERVRAGGRKRKAPSRLSPERKLTRLVGGFTKRGRRRG